MKKIAIIGAGNLGIAIAEGLIKNKAFLPEQIIATRNNLQKIEHLKSQGVTITSIENTTGSHIVINAQSNKYELLGYLKGKIITDGILSPSTVISTSGVKQNDTVMVVIEGDLP